MGTLLMFGISGAALLALTIFVRAACTLMAYTADID